MAVPPRLPNLPAADMAWVRWATDELRRVGTNQNVLRTNLSAAQQQAAFAQQAGARALEGLGTFNQVVPGTPQGAPQIPDQPILLTDHGTVTIQWDGFVHANISYDPQPGDPVVGSIIEPAQGFAQINVYRGASATGPWSLIGGRMGRAGSIVDTNVVVGTTYWYTFETQDNLGDKSAFGVPASIVVEGVDLGTLATDVTSAITAAQAAGDAGYAAGVAGQAAADAAQAAADTAESHAAAALLAGTSAESIATAAAANASAALTSANGKNTVFYQTSAPSTSGRITGDTWFDTDDGYKLYVWNGTAWTGSPFGSSALGADSVTASQLLNGTVDATKLSTAVNASISTATSTANSKTTAYYQTSAPGTTGRVVGDLWFDTDDGYRIYVWNGTAWTSSQLGSGALSADSVTASQILNGTVDATKLSSAVNTSITTAQSTATAAQNTANVKTTAYYQISAPSTSSRVVGDLWFDTDDGYRIYVWNGSAWTSSQLGSGALGTDSVTATQLLNGTVDATKLATAVNTSITTAQSTATGAQNTANLKTTAYYQTSAPSTSGRVIGDLWFDTDDGYKIYVWNGTAWTGSALGSSALGADSVTATQLLNGTVDATKLATAVNTSITTAQSTATAANTAAGNAQTTANAKTTAYYQTAAPATSGRVVGDLWFDTDDGYRIYVWNGTAWTSSQLGSAALGADSVTATQILNGVVDSTKLATAVNTSITTAQSTATGAQNTANLKTTAYYQISAPGTSGRVVGDLWFDTDDGYRIYVWNGTAWTSSQLGSSALGADSVTATQILNGVVDSTKLATAVNTSISTAQTTANGKNTVFYQISSPSTSGRVTGDIWFDTDDGYKIYVWNGSAWTASALGSSALGTDSVTATQLLNASVDSTKLSSAVNTSISTATSNASTALTAANSKTKVTFSTSAASGSGTTVGDLWFTQDVAGVITGQQVWTGSAWLSQTLTNSVIATLDAGKITTGTLSAARIGANTITAGMMVAGTITAASGIIADAAITAAKISTVDAGSITTGTLSAARIGANSISTTQLAIADATSYVPDPKFTMGTMPVGGTIFDSTNVAVPSGAPLGKVWQMPAGFDIFATPSTGGGFAVEPGDQFYMEALVRYSGAGSNSLSLRAWSSSNNAYATGGEDWAVNAAVTVTPTTSVGGVTPSAGWVKISGTITIPTNGTQGTTKLQRYVWAGIGDGNATGWWVTNWYMRRMTAGTLVVDGSITATKMVAGTITAASGILATASVTTATIADATITAAKISSIDAGTITAGTLAAARIGAGTITATMMVSGTITAASGILAAASVTTATIADATITAAKISSIDAGTITAGTLAAARIGANTITATMMVAGTITAASGILAAASVTTATIADATITAAKISSIDAGTITTGTLAAARIGANTITATMMVAGTITAASGILAAASVTTATIADATITAAKISSIDAGTITTGTLAAARIGANTITAGMMVTGTITAASGVIANLAITNAMIADATITSAKISAIDAGKITTGTLAAAQIGANTIDATKMVAGTITAASGILANLSVGTAQIQDLAITSAKVTALDAGKITTGTLIAAVIGANTIDATKMVAGTITAASGILATASVVTANIANLAVGTAQIADLAVADAKIATLTGSKIIAGSITTGKFQAGAIVTNDIAAGSIDTNRLAAGAITSDKVSVGFQDPSGTQVNRLPSAVTDQPYWALVLAGTPNLGGAVGVTALTTGLSFAASTTVTNYIYVIGRTEVPQSRKIHITINSTTTHVLPEIKYYTSAADVTGTLVSPTGPFSGAGTTYTFPVSAYAYTMRLKNDLANVVDVVTYARVFEVVGSTVSATSQATEISPAGLRLYYGGNAVIDLSTGSNNLLSIMAPSSSGLDTVASIDVTGRGNFATLAADTIYANGNDVVGGLVNSAPNGKDWGSTGLFDRAGRGVVYDCTWDTMNATIISTQYKRIAQDHFVLEDGRTYMVMVDLGGLQCANQSSGQNVYVELQFSLTPLTSVTSGDRWSRAVLYNATKGYYAFPPFTVSAKSGATSSANDRILPSGVNIYWQINTNISVAPGASYQLDEFGETRGLTVIDVGSTYLIRPTGGALPNATDRSTTGGASGTTTTVSTTQTWTAAWSRSWNSSGSTIVSGTGQYTNGAALYQGNGSTPMGSKFGFAALGITGKTITNMQLYMKNTYVSYPGTTTALLGTHADTAAPATYTGARANGWSVAWGNGEGKWITVPSAQWTGWAAGTYRGFSLGVDGNNNMYGYWAGATMTNPPQIKITYQ